MKAPPARKRSRLPCPAERLAGEALGTLPCPESRRVWGTDSPEEITAFPSSLVQVVTIGNIISTERESANMKITL